MKMQTNRTEDQKQAIEAKTARAHELQKGTMNGMTFEVWEYIGDRAAEFDAYVLVGSGYPADSGYQKILFIRHTGEAVPTCNY